MCLVFLRSWWFAIRAPRINQNTRNLLSFRITSLVTFGSRRSPPNRCQIEYRCSGDMPMPPCYAPGPHGSTAGNTLSDPDPSLAADRLASSALDRRLGYATSQRHEMVKFVDHVPDEAPRRSVSHRPQSHRLTAPRNRLLPPAIKRASVRFLARGKCSRIF
jgi:hypothetical protein